MLFAVRLGTFNARFLVMSYLHFFFAVIAFTLGAAAAADRPNVVLIFADDLGYGDLSSYGSENIRTPNLDRLANEGIRFTDFYAAANVCTPSRAALLTGCYAKRVGLQHRVNTPYSQHGLHSAEITLAEILKAQGYATGCFGKWHLGHLPEFLPTVQGFDEYWGIPYSNDMGNHYYARDSRGEEIAFVSPPLPIIVQADQIGHDPDQRFLTADSAARAVDFIERKRDQPFFCYVPLAMPHTPIAASPRFRGKSAGGFYGDVIEEIDAAVGKLAAAIDRLGLKEKTMIIFTSDNGGVVRAGDAAYGSSSNGPLRGQKATTWEGGHRVPFIVRWPGTVPAGAVCAEMTVAMDLLPTIARFAGTTEPPDRIIDGKDARALWLGEPGAKSPRESYLYYSNEDIHAVRGGDWKLHVKRPDWKQQGFTESDVYLFNLRRDPGETSNIAADHPDQVKRLAVMIDAARNDLGDTAVANARGGNIRPAGMGASPPQSWLPQSIAKLSPGSKYREELERALRAAPNVAYKMRDWQWAELDGQALTLDAWWPRGAGPWPMVVWVHGGGFKERVEYAARSIAAEGYVVLNIAYRHTAGERAAVEDCLGGVVWAKREAARFNGDPGRVAIAGEGTGGKLVALAACAADHGYFRPTGARPGDPDPFVQAMIAVSSDFGLETPLAAEDRAGRRQLVKQNRSRSERDLTDFSPLTYLDSHDPTVLLLWSDREPLHRQSANFQLALERNHIAHEFVALPGAGPDLIPGEPDAGNTNAAHGRMVQFLERVLKKPKQ